MTQWTDSLSNFFPNAVEGHEFTLNIVDSLTIKKSKKYEPVEDKLDSEQYFLEKMMLPHAERILNSENQIKELVEINYKLIDNDILNMIEQLKESFHGKIALVGGIVINTPHTHNGYFDLRRWEVD